MGNNRAAASYWNNWLPCCCCEDESHNERSSEFEVAKSRRKGSRSSRTVHSRRRSSSHTHSSHHHSSRHSSHSRHSKRSHNRAHHSHSYTKESLRIGPADYSPRFNNVEQVVEWVANGKEYKVPFRPQYIPPAASSLITYQHPPTTFSRPAQEPLNTASDDRNPKVISSGIIGHHYGPEKAVSIYRGNERTVSNIVQGLPPPKQDSYMMSRMPTMPQSTRAPPYTINESVFRYEQEGYATESSDDDSETLGSTSYESLLVVDEDDVTHYTEARLRDAPRKRRTAVFLKKRGLDGAKRLEKWLVLPPRD